MTDGRRDYLRPSVLSAASAAASLYRRNRYYDPASGRFTQEDPIGIPGGLNVYGFADGDPVNFSDPFGLCPLCVVAYGIFEAGATLYDAADLAITGVNYLRGRASGRELTVTAAGAVFGIVGFGGGYGRAARSAERVIVGRLVKDATGNPGNWRTIGSFTEKAVSKKARGGISIQTVLENADGDRLVRHTVLDKDGKVIDDHFRPVYKPRDVDGND